MRVSLCALMVFSACGVAPVAPAFDAGIEELVVEPVFDDAGVPEDLDAPDASVDEPVTIIDEPEPAEPDAGGEESGEEDAGQAELPDAGVANAPEPLDHQPFRVMTYNVRGPLDTGAHAWSARRQKVIDLILANAPDVVGVQEAQVDNGADIPADLIAGLSSVYGSYTYSSATPKIIFYKKTRFTRVGQGNKILRNPYATSHACYSKSNNKRLAWVKLRDQRSGKEYFIGNTHLAFSDCAQARLQQAEDIKGLVEQHAGALPVIVMGDFNVDDSRSSETAIEVMEGTGRTLYRTQRYQGATPSSEATFNSRWNGTGTNTSRLDYIFISGREITSAAPTIDRSPGTDTGTPSDHFAVLATIRAAIFEPGSTLTQVPDGESAATRLFYADVNGDGCADHLSWQPGFGGGQTYWARSTCTGTFAAPVPLGGGTSGNDTTRFFFADLTGDGCAEKVYWRPTYDGGNVRVYRGRCDGTFDAVVRPGVVSTSESTFFFFAKVTGDACADLVRWNATENSGRLTVYPSRCDGTVGFGAAVTGSGGAQTTAGTRLYFADVDGDGREDALAWHPGVSGGQTRAYKSNGAGAFTALFSHAAGTSGVATSRFYFADVDGDGLADKVFWRPDFRNGRAQIYLGTGSNFASTPIMDNTGYSASENTVFLYADTDGDGAADKTYWNPGANGGAAKVFRAR